MLETDIGWVCPICGTILIKLQTNSCICPKCCSYWTIPDDRGACPVCFSGLISVGHDGRICSNPKCSTWDIGIANNKTCYALSSELHYSFLENVFFEDIDGKRIYTYNTYNKKFIFMNQVLRTIWNDKLGIDVHSLPEKKHKWG